MFRLFAPGGFAGEVGGAGTVFGDSGFQDIAVADLMDDIDFDASFNRGGDIIRMPGNAADYTIARSGSSAVLDDGDSTYTIPVGTSGLAIVFADGVRSLLFDTSTGKVRIGSQVLDNTPTAINAPDDGTQLPTGADPQSTSRLFVSQAGAAVGGKSQVIGTSGVEEITYQSGDIVLDASFNKGGDTLHLNDPADAFSAYKSGSSIVLVSDNGTVTIPVGTAGMTLDFAGDERILRFDTTSGSVKIGDQEITVTTLQDAVQLGAGLEISLDRGVAQAPDAIDLQPGAQYVLNDDAGQNTNVEISGFNDDDLILVTGVASAVYNFTSGTADGDDLANDLFISFNDGTTFNIITIFDVVGQGFVYDEVSAEMAVGWNFISFG